MPAAAWSSWRRAWRPGPCTCDHARRRGPGAPRRSGAGPPRRGTLARGPPPARPGRGAVRVGGCGSASSSSCRCPGPPAPGPEQQVYDNALEQAVLADALGFDWVWAVEHHFLEVYSHCSAPEVFLTAVAARTERIRVGPRRRGVRAGDEPSRARRRAGRCARRHQPRPPRAGHGPVVDVDRAGGLRRRPGPDQEDVGRVRPGDPADVDEGRLRLRRHRLVDARAQRAAQARAGAPPAAVGHGHHTGDRARCRRSWARVPRGGGGELRRAGAAHGRVPPPHPVTATRSVRSSPTR